MTHVPTYTITRIVVFAAVAMLFTLQAQSDFLLPESNLTIKGRVTLLSIDDQSLSDRNNLSLTLSKPTVRREPVLTPEQHNLSAPDSLASHFYGTVLYDQGLYRMWYYSLSLLPKPVNFNQGPVSYAESKDGIHWVKPNLGQVEINGSTNNNAVKLSDEMTQCAAVIIDEEDPDPKRRYKMIYMALAKTWIFRSATSADGIHWNVNEKYPTDKFLEMGSFLRFGEKFIVHGQGSGTDPAGNPEGRHGYASTSIDFENWEQNYKQAFRLPEPEEMSLRGLEGDYPQVHLGIGATSFGNVAVGLYGIWHNPSPENRRKSGWYGAGVITCDLGLVVSNDGVTYREPVKDNIFISSKESPVASVDSGGDPTILCQANGILNVGDKTLIYHGRWLNTFVYSQEFAEIAIATLPRDRWGSLQLAEGQSQGTVWSAPITLPKEGCSIVLNADKVQGLTIELADEDKNLLKGYSNDQKGMSGRGKSLDRHVKWDDKNLKALGGKTVRLKINVSNAKTKLFAVYLDSKK